MGSCFVLLRGWELGGYFQQEGREKRREGGGEEETLEYEQI